LEPLAADLLRRSSGTRTGTFSSVTVPDSRWHVGYQSDGTMKIVYVNGTLIFFR